MAVPKKQKRNRPTLTITLDKDMIEFIESKTAEDRSSHSAVIREAILKTDDFRLYQVNHSNHGTILQRGLLYTPKKSKSSSKRQTQP